MIKESQSKAKMHLLILLSLTLRVLSLNHGALDFSLDQTVSNPDQVQPLNYFETKASCLERNERLKNVRLQRSLFYCGMTVGCLTLSFPLLSSHCPNLLLVLNHYGPGSLLFSFLLFTSPPSQTPLAKVPAPRKRHIFGSLPQPRPGYNHQRAYS